MNNETIITASGRDNTTDSRGPLRSWTEPSVQVSGLEDALSGGPTGNPPDGLGTYQS